MLFYWTAHHHYKKTTTEIQHKGQVYRFVVCHFKVCDEIISTYFKTAPRSASRSLASPWSSPEQGMMSASVYLKPRVKEQLHLISVTVSVPTIGMARYAYRYRSVLRQIPNGSDRPYPLDWGLWSEQDTCVPLCSRLKCTWRRERCNFLIIISWDVPVTTGEEQDISRRPIKDTGLCRTPVCHLHPHPDLHHCHGSPSCYTWQSLFLKRGRRGITVISKWNLGLNPVAFNNTHYTLL